MAFDIDKMKADGVSSHLIELAELSERSDTAAFEKIAMGIENTEIFRQFISMESDAPVWDYMYAAGMCTKEEADWFKSEENQYIIKKVTITFIDTMTDNKVTAWGELDAETALIINPKPNPYLANVGETILLPEGFEIGEGNTTSLYDGSFTVDGSDIGGHGNNYIVEKDVTIEYSESQE